MDGSPPSSWSQRARHFAVTVLIVTFALSFAVSFLRAIAPVLIFVAVVSVTAYSGVLAARYRRSRW